MRGTLGKDGALENRKGGNNKERKIKMNYRKTRERRGKMNGGRGRGGTRGTGGAGGRSRRRRKKRRRRRKKKRRTRKWKIVGFICTFQHGANQLGQEDNENRGRYR